MAVERNKAEELGGPNMIQNRDHMGDDAGQSGPRQSQQSQGDSRQQDAGQQSGGGQQGGERRKRTRFL